MILSHSIEYYDTESVNNNDITIQNINNESILNQSLEYNKTIFDPNMHQRILCVEMANNNKVYINYQFDWKIKDVNSF